MAKKTSSNQVADKIATFIGRSLGTLINRKEALLRQIAAVDDEIADVQKQVSGRFDAMEGGGRRRKAAAALAREASRAVSAESRAKMAASAKRRWAAVKKVPRG